MPQADTGEGFFDRSLLLNALVTACDKIDTELAKELQERDRKQHAFLTHELERLSARAAEADRLQEENGQFRDQIWQQAKKLAGAERPPSTGATSRTDTCPMPNVSSGLNGKWRLPSISLEPPQSRLGKRRRDDALHEVRMPLGDLSGNASLKGPPSGIPQSLAAEKRVDEDDGSLKDRYDKLWADHNKLLSKLKAVKDANEQLQAVARRARRNERAWFVYGESLEKELGRPLSKFLAALKPQETAATERGAGTTKERLRAASRASPISVFASAVNEGATPLQIGSISSSRSPVVAQKAPDQSNGGSEAGSAKATSNDPDSGPKEAEINDDLPRQVQGLSNANRSETKINPEPSSDGPIIISERCLRNKKQPGRVPDHASTTRLKREDTGSDPIVAVAVGVGRHSTQESLDLDNDNDREELPTPKKCRSMAPDENPGDGGGPARLPTPRPGLTRHPQNLIRCLSHESGRVSNEEPPSPQEDPFRVRSLDDLLNAALLRTEKPVLSRPNGQARSRSPGKTPRREQADKLPQLPPARVLPFDKPPPQQKQRTNAARTPTGASVNTRLPLPPIFTAPSTTTSTRPQTTTARPNAAAAPQPKPLRSLPLVFLKLDDFKPNPKHTAGLNHAFADVVRGKEERAGLPGCTDPTCPGGRDWRAVARSELSASGAAGAGRGGSLLGQPQSTALMESFLGDDAHQLASMGRAEREELWVEARAWEQANRYGRCRHRFPRAPTPEQYWDTGFPSTQDLIRDREEGERTERRMIEQRYREAMRKGGVWLFKDE